ncbi:hypothetical protein ACFVQB_14340 [Paenibacillus sp. NPDC057886]|uniref:hypothetical protein n=1 Tax=Paenibacillus sp. NPDC057886 TaxID=3346270 RepID=UPI0036AA82C5
MIKHGLGNLYGQLKDMETRLRESERRIIEYTIVNKNPNKDVSDKLIEDYRQLKEEFDSWMLKCVYEDEK